MKGFWTQNSSGHAIHIVGDPKMTEETRRAIVAMSDALVERYERIKKYFMELWNHPYKRNQSASIEAAEYWYREGFDRADHERSTKESNAREKAAQPITGERLDQYMFTRYNGYGSSHHFYIDLLSVHSGKILVSFEDYYCQKFEVPYQVWLVVAGDSICLHHIKTVGQLADFYELVEGKTLKERPDEGTATA